MEVHPNLQVQQQQQQQLQLDYTPDKNINQNKQKNSTNLQQNSNSVQITHRRNNILTSLMLKPSLNRTSRILLQPVQTTRNINRLNTGVSYTSHYRVNSINDIVISNNKTQLNGLQQNEQILNQTQITDKSREYRQDINRNTQQIQHQNNLNQMKNNQKQLENVTTLNQTTPLEHLNIQGLQNKFGVSNRVVSIIKPVTTSGVNTQISRIENNTGNHLPNITKEISAHKNETAQLFQDLKSTRQELIRNHRQLQSHQKPTLTINNNLNPLYSQKQRAYTSHNNKTNLQLNTTANNDNIIQELLKINKQQNNYTHQHKLKDYSMSIRHSYDSYKFQTPKSNSNIQRIDLNKSVDQNITNSKQNFNERQLNESSQNQGQLVTFRKSLNQQRALSLLFNSYKGNLNQKYRNQIRNTIQTQISNRSYQISYSPTSITNPIRTTDQQIINAKTDNMNINQIIQRQRFAKVYNTENSPSKNSSTLRGDDPFKNKYNNNRNLSLKDNSFGKSPGITNHTQFKTSIQILQSQQEQYRKQISTHSRTSSSTNNKFIQPIKNSTTVQLKIQNQLSNKNRSNKLLKLNQSLDEKILEQLNNQVDSNQNTINNNEPFFITEAGNSVILQTESDDINLLEQKLLEKQEVNLVLKTNISQIGQNIQINKSSNLIQNQDSYQTTNKLDLQQSNEQNLLQDSHNVGSYISKGKAVFYKKDQKSLDLKLKQNSFGIQNLQKMNKQTTENKQQNNQNHPLNQQMDNKFMKLMKFDLDEEFQKIQRMMIKQKQKSTITSSIDDSGRSRHKTQSSRRVRFDIQQNQQQPVTIQSIVKLSQPDT